MLQRCVLDAGFSDFMITPIGGDNVFLYHKGDVNVISVYNEAAEIFVIICMISDLWSKDNIIPYERCALAELLWYFYSCLE
jgi:hypothetical protein